MKKIYNFLFLFLFLHSSGQLFITEVYRDTPYSEFIDNKIYTDPTPILEILRKRHRGEFIEIYNASDTDLNLKDWFLRDDEGVYNFNDKIIKSGQFIVVVANNNEGGDYFPNFFSTTQGKSNQIIYQNVIKLNNTEETITLAAKSIGGNPLQQEFITSSIGFQGNGNFGINFGSITVVNNPSLFYDVNDWQYGFDSPQIPNPLSAEITPPIKPLSYYMGDILYQNYQNLTWDSNVDDLLSILCNIPINPVSQYISVSTTSGGKSFAYDEAGNAYASNTYTSVGNPTPSIGYSVDELELIKNAIQLAPNPTYGLVNVSITGVAKGKVESVQVFSGVGALLFTKNNLQDSNNFNFSFTLENQITGVYLANFTLNSGQVTSKNILKY